MTYRLEPRVRETSTTTSTDPFTLGGAMLGSLSFAQAMSIGDTCDYVASYNDTFEEGTGTLTSSTTLSRDTVSRALHSGGTVDQTKVNFVAGTNTIIMTIRSDKAKGAPFDSGTLALFQQTAAPTGWTKQTTHNDKALRLASGTASSGGTYNFTDMFNSDWGTDSHTLSTSEIPSHSHSTSESNHSHGVSGGTKGGTTSSTITPGAGLVPSNSTDITIVGNTTGLSINPQGGDGSHDHGLTLAVKYVDLIIAAKN